MGRPGQKSFHRVTRNDFDADDAHAFVGAVLWMRGRGADFFQNVVAFDQLAERGVLMVEERRVAMTDEKLAAGGIGIVRAGHGNDAAHVRAVIELGLDLVTRPARAPQVFLARVLGQRVAALNHETFDDPVKTSAVIKAFLGEGFEILDGLGRDLGPEFDDHFTFGGVDDGDFVGVCGSAHGCGGWGVRFGFVSQSRHHSSGKDNGAHQVECFHGRKIFQIRGQKSRAESDISSRGWRNFFGFFLILAPFLMLFLVLACVFVLVFVLVFALAHRECDEAGVVGFAQATQHEKHQTTRHRQNCHAYGQSAFPANPGTFGRRRSGNIGLCGNGTGWHQRLLLRRFYFGGNRGCGR